MNSPEIVTLGCRMNLSESETIRTMLGDAGDVVVINSCAVTNEAVRQTRQAIRRARRARPNARLLVTGCAAEIERKSISEMPEVDGLIANAAKLDPRAWNLPSNARVQPSRHTRAFIAVQTGCDHACTFCIIPQGRGRSRSLAIREVLREIAAHLQHGAPEIVLTGVDLTSWGHDLPGQPPLGTLVRDILNEFPQLARLRMSSLDGIEIDPLLFELLASEERVMPHLHLSLQHGHDLILKRMKRRHLRADAVALVTSLRDRRRDLAVGADLIAGFPTETAAHHEANISVVEELGIVHGHVFPFSPRAGTPAARMPQLARETVKSRAAEIRTTVARLRKNWLQTMVGKNLSVLCELDGCGYAENFARVALPPGTPAGAIVNFVPARLDKGLLA